MTGKIKFLLFAIFSLFTVPTQAGHFWGLDFEYKHLGGRTYEFKYQHYTECGTTAWGPGTIIYEPVPGFCGTAIYGTPVLDTLIELTQCPNTPSLCANPSTQLYGMRYAIMRDTITFPAGCDIWEVRGSYLSFDWFVTNITNPVGTEWDLKIQLDVSTGSSSPVWNAYPPLWSFVGQPNVADFSTIDPDGDVIVYSLEPAMPNYSPASYSPGFSPIYPVISYPGTFTFWPGTGILSYTGSQIQNSIVSVKAEEWRGGVMIGYVKRSIPIRVISGTSFVDGCPPGLYTNLLCGDVYMDLNNNCTKDPGEPPYAYPPLISLNSGYPATYTNLAGNFRFWRGQGTDSLTLSSPYFYPQDPNGLWEVACTPTPVTFPATNDTICGVDFGLQARDTCPLLKVDISYNRFRFCNPGRVYIHYKNLGTQTATNSYLEVHVPDSISILSTSLPASSVNGKVMTFQLGNLTPLSQGTLTIATDSVCNPDLMFRTFPWYAHIYPDSGPIPPSPNWDRSHIEVLHPECVNDSLATFTIKNSGTGNMSDSSKYFFRQRCYLTKVDSFKLNAGDSIIVSLPAGGRTVDLRAGNDPDHPWKNPPFAFVEACDTLPGTATYLLTTWIPNYYSRDPFHDYLLPQLNAPFDPNDKTVTPEGFDPNYHFIEADQMLKYKIRFQNLGNDTAFNVVILDTLPPELELTSFRPVFGTHPYQIQLVGPRTIQIYFPNINLPPASTNDAGSQGFFEYEMEQVPNNPLGTRIENRAAIYFDFNPPIITNYAFNTIGELGELTSATHPGPAPEEPKAVAFPNPFSESVTIRLEKGRGLAAMYDLYGRKIAEKTLDAAGEAQFDLSGYAEGMYLYTLSRDGRRIAAGKVLKR